MSGVSIPWRQNRRAPLRRSQMQSDAQYDLPLLIAIAVLLGVGLVMVGSASISIADRQLGAPFYYLLRQMVYVGVGVSLAFVAVQTPLEMWERNGPLLLMVTLLLLLAVLIPGVGRTVNGSTRWLSLIVFNLQVSELVKLALIVYAAGYLVRRGDEVRSTVGGFVKPLGLLVLIAVLLLAEPDFGAVVVMGATLMGMLFLAGVRLWLFGLLASVSAGLLGIVAVASPYRLERLTAFLNPWADPFNSGFQLTQALIALGPGDWVGGGRQPRTPWSQFNPAGVPPAQHLGEDSGCDGGQERDRDDAATEACDFPRLADDGFGIDHEALQRIEYLPAGVGKDNAALVPVKQLYTQGLLQLLDLHRESRL